MSIELLYRELPTRSVALRTPSHSLIISHFLAENASGPRCMVEFSEGANIEGYMRDRPVFGTLGLITINNDVFLCVVSGVSDPITIRPGETVRKIRSVDFYCLSTSIYDRALEQINRSTFDEISEDGYGHDGQRDRIANPCLDLKKLLSDGTFYYSSDFDLTRRLQKRITDEAPTIATESFDSGFLWNSYLIQPVMDFRSRLANREKNALDASKIITSAIRGFCGEISIPPSSSPLQKGTHRERAHLSVFSRLSSRKAGTRFNARGIDDDGNVANFVESETTLWSPTGDKTGECFSYVQVRGSLPVFWEQPANLIPGKVTITITRSLEATQPAFDKHFENLDHSYRSVHVINLLADDWNKQGEVDLTRRYEEHIERAKQAKEAEAERQLLKYTHYDFHAETKAGYDAARGVAAYIQDSARAFEYMFAEDREEYISNRDNTDYTISRKATLENSQEGVFRTNCLDCLDRTNVVEEMISQMALESFFDDRKVRGAPDFWMRHRTLWADNGDSLSKIYAGTGALKSSFTRSGKMSFGGLVDDLRKSATRMYHNNFTDQGKQDTIDMLLGRNINQQSAQLYDAVNDWVQAQLKRRAPEYTTSESVQILVTTLNLMGKTRGLSEDLTSMLHPCVDRTGRNPEIIVVALQEMVDLSPQQLLKDDPYRRQQWEQAVKMCLDNIHSGDEEYILLRGGQLIGAALMIFVRRSILGHIKNVEQSTKKTGMSGLAGNKGAVAIRMDFDNTSLCFVTAHLAAGFANYEDRNRDYRLISQGLRFQRNRAIDDHECVIWAGDFNYRIGLSNEVVRRSIDRQDFVYLIENDQLYIQRTNSNVRDVFDHYNEEKITFLPTYKFDLGTDVYDTSDKARVPAWTDRILWKGNNLRQTSYNSVPSIKFSDHRPVYGTFTCVVSMIDERYKEKLSSELYKKRKMDVEAGTAEKVEEDLISFDAPEKLLPPPSSSRRKWWLDHEMPASATIAPPGRGYIVNPNIDNPFEPTDEPDWVRRPPPVPRKPVNLI